MFKVKTITVGRCKEPWLLAALAEYEKRLKGRVQFEWVFAKEMDELLILCMKESHFIALDSRGELLCSQTFSQKWTSIYEKTTFVIGGADGLSEEILKRARWRWSLSPLTFTHQMVRLILMEQLYRAIEISKNSPYHK